MRYRAETRQTGRLVRPYTMTGGRTGAEVSQIALEAHVASTAFGSSAPQEFRWEAAAILDQAQTPTAVVELAAVLELPIGVVRVLAGDLEERGAVTITTPASEIAAEGGDSHVELLQRVLDGIKSL